LRSSVARLLDPQGMGGFAVLVLGKGVTNAF
jgi:SAM-dependent MidA family methyltransferase